MHIGDAVRAAMTAAVGVIVIAVIVVSAANQPPERAHRSLSVEDVYAINGLAWHKTAKPCGYNDDTVRACFDGKTVWIRTGDSPQLQTFALWHELHHYIDKKNGTVYAGSAAECAADAFAYAHDAAARGSGFGYHCHNGVARNPVPQR